MSEVRGPLPKMSQYGRLDRLHSFRLFRVVGYPVFRAVGVRHKQCPFAVVAAAGAHRFAFFLPRLVTESSAPCSGVLTGPAVAQLLCAAAGELSRVGAAGFAQSWAFGGLTEHTSK